MKIHAKLALVLLLLASATWTATPPALINYQGVLRDAAGAPRTGSFDMTFRFYDLDAGGTLLLTDAHDTGAPSGQVAVSNGLFTAQLGGGTITPGSELNLAEVFRDNATVWLEIQIAPDALPMTPRVRVIASAYAQNATALEGHNAGYFLNTSATAQTKAEKLTLNGVTDYGIYATGPTAGGYFKDADNNGYANVGYGAYGIQAFGSTSGGYFKDLNDSGSADVGWGNYGISARGTTLGGYFQDSDSSGYAFIAYGDKGIEAHGQVYGVEAYGDTGSGGYFKDSGNTGYAYVGYGDRGIDARAVDAGGHFKDIDSSGDAYVGSDTYKIFGSGTMSFVQNHPNEKDRVIVYAAPEGDEVAVYTRGTARLVSGEAHVKLDETFQWVTNPDIGLTAHISPKGQWADLFVESVSTTELVVRSKDCVSDAAFDYVIYGLRIGFEESSIVQEKQQESYIPSFKNHRERYAKHPELRAYNSLERFKGMETAAGLRASFDFSASKALHDAIHEYDPATDPPADQLFDHGYEQPSHLTAESAMPLPSSPSLAAPPVNVAAQAAESPTAPQARPAAAPAAPAPPEPAVKADRFPVAGTVEPGDVLVMNPANGDELFKCTLKADPMVVGIATGDREMRNEKRETLEDPANKGEGDVSHFAFRVSHEVPVVVGGITLVKADATLTPITKGDLLVTSPTLGHAMKAQPTLVNGFPMYQSGTIIGKALEPLDSGTGLIRVLVMLR